MVELFHGKYESKGFIGVYFKGKLLVEFLCQFFFSKIACFNFLWEKILFVIHMLAKFRRGMRDSEIHSISFIFEKSIHISRLFQLKELMLCSLARLKKVMKYLMRLYRWNFCFVTLLSNTITINAGQWNIG